MLYTYWKGIFHCFSEAFGRHWDPDPLVTILVATSLLVSDKKYEKKSSSVWDCDCKEVDFVDVETGYSAHI